MVFVLYAESYGSVRGFALMHGDRICPNRELYALGLSNLVSGLFGGLPVGAGYSGTSANEAAGARSRMAAWAAALVVLMVVFCCFRCWRIPATRARGGGHQRRKPYPQARPLRIYFRWQRDRLVLVFAIAAVLLLGILDGLLVAVGASLLLTLRDLSRHRLSVLGRLGEGHDFVSTSTHPRARQIRA